ncbi:15926_t:CDS:2, partial [Gigaspora rosea]
TLRTLTEENLIEVGGLEQWVDTRWHTMYNCVFSVIRHKVPLEIIRNNNSDILNTSVQAILRTRAFFDDLNALAFVLYPIKIAISTLESRDCSLADCVVSLVRLGTAIKRLPENDYLNFHIVWAQGTFRHILLAADNFYEKMGKAQKERRILMSQLRSYRCCAAPFDIPFADNESPTMCKIENMQKLSAFHLANSKKELQYFLANNDDDELHEALFNMNLGDYDDYDKEEQPTSEEVQDDEFPEEETLKIEELLNIDVADFTNGLGEIVFTANFESFEEEDVNIQNNDVESNVDEGNWDPEKEAESMLD